MLQILSTVFISVHLITEPRTGGFLPIRLLKGHKLMGLKSFFKKEEHLISVDIGGSSVKLVELDTTGAKPVLMHAAISPLGPEAFSGNTITSPSKVSQKVVELLETNEINDRRVITAIPCPSVFTKRIKVPKMDPAELAGHIQFEATNFIPHNINAVRLDYHVLGPAGKNQLEVLVAAAKNEVIDSFLAVFDEVGFQVAVVDVDCFALQNCFELSYPEMVSKTVALLNIGARYSSLNVCRGGSSLFTGDIPVGGKLFTDALVDSAGITASEAEQLKRTNDKRSPYYDAWQEVLDTNVEYVAGEINRQLSFFWNASGTEEGIDQVLITGGGALVPGLTEEITEKTGLACDFLQPFRGIELGEDFDRKNLEEVSPFMAVAVGMGIRQPGDRVTAGE